MRYLDVPRSVPIDCMEALHHFWDPEALRAFWPNIQSFDVRYDDGAHQEGVMTVLRDGAREQLRVSRFRGEKQIRFFNPDPPPGMATQTGSWRFEEGLSGRCVVRAQRTYALRRRAGESSASFAERDESFARSLEARLRALLDAFARHVSARGAAGATRAGSAALDTDRAPDTSAEVGTPEAPRVAG